MLNMVLIKLLLMVLNVEVFSLQGLETRDQSYFITENNIERLKQAKEANRVQVCSSISHYIKCIMLHVILM